MPEKFSACFNQNHSFSNECLKMKIHYKMSSPSNYWPPHFYSENASCNDVPIIPEHRKEKLFVFS